MRPTTRTTHHKLLAVVSPLFGAALGWALGCSGSSSKPPPELLSSAHFEAIHKGMTMAQVQQIIGQWTVPPQSDASPARYQWKRGETEIDVDFVNERVAAKTARGLPPASGDSSR